MAVTISIVSQKGGVGKTSLTQNLGYELSKMGQKVLLVDFDPQANLTMGHGVNPYGKQTKTIYDAMTGNEDVLDCIVGINSNLALIPASLDLSEAEIKFNSSISRNLKLKEALEPVRDACDFIIVDGPPSLGFFTVNSLMCANQYLIPLQVHPYAYRALDQLYTIIDEARTMNSGLRMLGVVLTMYDKRNSLTSAIEDMASSRFNGELFQTPIPVNVRIPEATLDGVSVAEFEADCNGAKAYSTLAQEVLARVS